MNVKDFVKDGKLATFAYYKLGELWYTVDGFMFPIPVKDTAEVGDATFNREEKALLLMRYIRKHIKFLEEAKAQQREETDHPMLCGCEDCL
jgi:hypothetical protein